jgi:hypothetical protein
MQVDLSSLFLQTILIWFLSLQYYGSYGKKSAKNSNFLCKVAPNDGTYYRWLDCLIKRVISINIFLVNGIIKFWHREHYFSRHFTYGYARPFTLSSVSLRNWAIRKVTMCYPITWENFLLNMVWFWVDLSDWTVELSSWVTVQQNRYISFFLDRSPWKKKNPHRFTLPVSSSIEPNH